MDPDQPTATGPAPPPASTLPATRPAGPDDRPAPGDEPAVGMRVGRFLLLEPLGKGAFGRVFLAAEETLDRKVALKVSRARAMGVEEGRSLGGLEHDHIVKVYSEFTHPETGWHCLCLQYVPGADLRAVIDRVHKPDSPPTSGRAILDALDAAARRDGAFDPAALRDREALAADDFPQAVCRIGRRLAEALAFAHARGVLHCDVKPANVLLTAYGRPMLADFNISFDRDRKAAAGDSGLGGTVGYMAPEYLYAVREGTAGWVDGRCDVYSLGVVLHELATGARPGRAPDPLDRVPRELAAVVRRCLDPDPDRRYQTAGELADALDRAWHLLAARRVLPPAGRVGRWAGAHPVAALAAAGLLPHVAASAVNISYNAVEIRLTGPQERAFLALVVGYNLVVYPACAAVLFAFLRGIARRLAALPRAGGAAVDDLRRRVRNVAWLAVWLGAAGWLPGGLLFPLGIDLWAGSVPGSVYAHFAVSFTLSCLVGVVFSYLAVVYVALRVLFPWLGNPDAGGASAVAADVRPLAALFGPFVLLACAVPLTGAVLLVVLADGPMPLGFRLLVAGLIGLGVAAVGLAERLVRRLNRLAAVWAGLTPAPAP